MAKPTVSFNGYDLATYVAGLIVVGTDPYRFPARELNTAKIANTDKSVTNSAYYKDKKINVLVEIGATSRELLDAALDQLNLILQAHEAALVCSYGSGTRQWNATLSNVMLSNVIGGHAEIDLEFECSNPIGTDVNSTALFSNTLSGSSNSVSFLLGGTAEWQQPIITITYSALTGGTGKVVTVGNSASGQSVSITRTWTAGDVLVIDSQAKTVKVNGTDVAFTGAIPEWNPGTAGMDYNDTLTTRTRATSALYYKRYI